MAVMEQGAPVGLRPHAVGPLTGTVLTLAAAAAGLVLLVVILFVQSALPTLAIAPISNIATLSIYGAAILFMGAGGLLMLVRPGLGGSIALVAALGWLAGSIFSKELGFALAAPFTLALLGSLTGLIANDRLKSQSDARLIYRQSAWTRITHWIWVVAMFFLLLTGLQIFNSRPNLYIGQQSGFEYDNSILDFGFSPSDTSRPQIRVLGHVFDDRGYQGTSGPLRLSNYSAIPSWAIIPSFHDLATGRVIHFFFAWILVGTLAVWLVNAIVTGHLWRDIILKPRDLRNLRRDIVDHLTLRFAHGRSYSPLQKIAYFVVFVLLFPLIILTGLTMSPGMDAAWPWLLDVFGGRQTARTIHFLTMVALVLFFIVHIVMVVLANPINELRSMITGYYKTNRHDGEEH